MNALVEIPAPRAVMEPTIIAGAPIRSLVPTSFEGVWRMAQMLAASPFSPKDMKSPEACAGAITLGLDLGITPIQAVQSIAVINGRPSIWGDLALALVRSSPLCEDVEESLSGEGDKMVAKCIARRKGAKPATGQFTVEDAKKAQLWNKSGPWQQYPKRMLQLRARAFALRDAFPDVLKGISIREEVEDIQARDVAPPPPPPPAAALAPPAPPVEDATILSETAAGAPPPGQPAAQDAEASPSNPAENASASAPVPDVSPDDILANLIDCMAMCQTVEAIHEGYEHLDVEADLSPFNGYVEKAREVKASHLARIERLTVETTSGPAEDAGAPPPPPADIDDDIPVGEPEPDISTRDAYETTLKAKLAVAGDVTAYEVVRKWWGETRSHRQDVLGIKDHADIARLQGYFSARKTELGI